MLHSALVGWDVSAPAFEWGGVALQRLQSCLKAATKAWIMSRPHLAVVIQPGGWFLGNRAAIAANWPYSCLGLLPGQVYQRLAKQTALQGNWGECSFQKVLINDRDFLLLEATTDNAIR
jgi:hypothetical protein